jgi:hypothetical protein
MEWVSQITTVVVEMVLPGVAGQWLDRRWGTKFLGLIGFGLGLTVGISHLLAMTRAKSGGQPVSRSTAVDTTETKDREGSAAEHPNGQD